LIVCTTDGVIRNQKISGKCVGVKTELGKQPMKTKGLNKTGEKCIARDRLRWRRCTEVLRNSRIKEDR